MGEANMHIDAQQIAVLADRFERMDESHKAMMASFDAMRLTFARFENTPAEVAALRVQVDAQSRQIEKHSLIIKLGGFILASCIGLIGWGWREYSTLKSYDMQADRRLYLVEFKLGLPPPPVEGSDK